MVLGYNPGSRKVQKSPKIQRHVTVHFGRHFRSTDSREDISVEDIFEIELIYHIYKGGFKTREIDIKPLDFEASVDLLAQFAAKRYRKYSALRFLQIF